MIYDLYLTGMGAKTIAGKMVEMKRKKADGTYNWEHLSVLRILNNKTYAGYISYNKSYTKNFLGHKRVTVRDVSQYEYVKGNFPAIVSEETWNRVQAIKSKKVVGGMVGGAVGGAVGKKVMDNFIEDDAIAMFRVMKEEFINVVMSSYLTQEEFEEVAKRTIWNKKVSKELQNMYKKSKSGEHRTYANSLIEEAVIDVLKKRRKITNEMWIEGQQLMGA